MRRHDFSLARVTAGPGCGGGAGAKGKGARVAAFTGRCYPLLYPALRRDMLACHDAPSPLYLNVAGVLAGGCGHGLQVGRRTRRGSLQRPAAPERAASERAGGADLQGGRYARDARRTARAARRRAATAVPGLRDRAAGGRPDAHQRRLPQHHRADRSGAAARRSDLPHATGSRSMAARRRGASSPSHRWIAARTPCRRWYATAGAGSCARPRA